MAGRAGWGRRMIAHGYWWFGLACLMAVIVTALPVSRLAFHPISVEITGDQVTLDRAFPGDILGLPRPHLSYVETVKPMTQRHNGGHPCVDHGGPFRYARADSVKRWSIDWAAACLSDPAGFVWSAQWTWHLGMFRFGAVGMTEIVMRDPFQYRVSSNGIIHGRESPHFEQTSRARCYATQAEAEAAIDGKADK